MRSRILLCPSLTISILLSCCTPERPQSQEEKSISFEVEHALQPWSSTRSEDEDASRFRMLPLQGSRDSLYLCESVTLTPAVSLSQLRAKEIKSEGEMESFKLFGYKYTDGSWENVRKKNPNFFGSNDAVLKRATSLTTEGNWKTAEKWPGSAYKVRFYAYYEAGNRPMGRPSATGAPSDAVQPYRLYTAPDGYEGMNELLIAKSSELSGDYNKPVTLQFKHALSQIKFVVGSDLKVAGTIKSITLKNLSTNARYEFEPEKWVVADVPRKDYTISNLNKHLTLEEASTKGTPITSETQSFMVIPQSLKGVSIEIIFHDDISNQDVTLSHTFAATDRWEMGKTYTYMVSTDRFNEVFTLELAGKQDYPYDPFHEVNGTFSVTSYKTRNGIKAPVKWKADYSVDGGKSWQNTPPAWMLKLPMGEFTPSSASPSTFNLELNRDIHHVNFGDYLMQKNPVSPDIVHLEGIPANSANCYIINAPGDYSFPLVYGNALKDGRDNTPAYESEGKFVDGKGVSITGPYLQGVSSVSELWHDTPDYVSSSGKSCVSNLKVDLAKKVVTFTITKEAITESNVLIGAKHADGTIIWSWHLWITPMKLSDTLVYKRLPDITSAKPEYIFLLEDLGTVRYQPYDPSLSTIIRITQPESGEVKTFTIKRLEYKDEVLYVDRNTYQFGRKDPFPTRDTYPAINTQVGSFNLTESNRMPTTFFMQKARTVGWADLSDVPNSVSSSLWNRAQKGSNTLGNVPQEGAIKSVYDPSPAGYMVPSSQIFYHPGSRNLYETLINGGFSLFGYRDGAPESSGYSLIEVDQNARYWTNTFYSDLNALVGFSIRIKEGSIRFTASIRGGGIRAVKE